MYVRRNQRIEATNSLRQDVRVAIRQMRQEMGLTQDGLAKRMTSKVDQSTIANWEAGKSEIKLTQLIDILMICGRDVSAYLSFLKSNKKGD